MVWKRDNQIDDCWCRRSSVTIQNFPCVSCVCWSSNWGSVTVQNFLPLAFKTLHLLRLSRPGVNQNHRSEHLIIAFKMMTQSFQTGTIKTSKTYVKLWKILVCLAFYRCVLCGLLVCPCLVFPPWTPCNLQAKNRAGQRLRMNKAR